MKFYFPSALCGIYPQRATHGKTGCHLPPSLTAPVPLDDFSPSRPRGRACGIQTLVFLVPEPSCRLTTV